MQIRVSEQFLDGFTKAAVASGVPQDKVQQLFKIAQQLQARAANPEAFDAGATEVLEKRGLNIPIKPLLWAALGGLGLMGGRAAGQGLAENSANHRFYGDLLQHRKLLNKRQMQKAMWDAAGGSAGGSSAGGGSSYGNYAATGIPF